MFIAFGAKADLASPRGRAEHGGRDHRVAGVDPREERGLVTELAVVREANVCGAAAEAVGAPAVAPLGREGTQRRPVDNPDLEGLGRARVGHSALMKRRRPLPLGTKKNDELGKVITWRPCPTAHSGASPKACSDIMKARHSPVRSSLSPALSDSIGLPARSPEVQGPFSSSPVGRHARFQEGRFPSQSKRYSRDGGGDRIISSVRFALSSEPSNCTPSTLAQWTLLSSGKLSALVPLDITPTTTQESTSAQQLFIVVLSRNVMIMDCRMLRGRQLQLLFRGTCLVARSGELRHVHDGTSGNNARFIHNQTAVDPLPILSFSCVRSSRTSWRSMQESIKLMAINVT